MNSMVTCPLLQAVRSRIDLHDLGFEGDIFTWRNNNFRVEGYIRERLDRAVATPSWCERFPGYKVVHGCPEKSDHRPVVLHLDGGRPVRRRHMHDPVKRFEARWLLEEDCDVRVSNAWEVARVRAEANVQQCMKMINAELQDWSHNILGDLAKRIKKLKLQLEECRREAISESTIRREQVLRFKLDRLEEQQDTMWRQRAHVNWLIYGDRNTKFFQSFASERKRRNAIKRLKKEDGVVVEGEEGLQALVTNYFSSLFTPVAGVSHGDFLHHITPKVTSQMNDFLMAEFTAEEVEAALKSIGDRSGREASRRKAA